MKLRLRKIHPALKAWRYFVDKFLKLWGKKKKGNIVRKENVWINPDRRILKRKKSWRKSKISFQSWFKVSDSQVSTNSTFLQFFLFFYNFIFFWMIFLLNLLPKFFDGIFILFWLYSIFCGFNWFCKSCCWNHFSNNVEVNILGNINAIQLAG